jgi:hypothetical protein
MKNKKGGERSTIGNTLLFPRNETQYVIVGPEKIKKGSFKLNGKITMHAQARIFVTWTNIT